MNSAITLAEQYRGVPDKVRLYGIIVYTDAHPHIVKVLRDTDYWDALNEIAGSKWVIFSVKPVTGAYEDPPPGGGLVRELVSVWKEPAENKALLEEFQLSSTERLPLLLVFTQSDAGEILKLTLELDDLSVERAFTSLKSAIALVTSAVDNISAANLHNAEGVFRAVEMRVDQLRQWHVLKKGVNIFLWIKGLLT